MIYTKQANFPYPLLRNGSEDYKDAEFNLDIELEEVEDNYSLKIKSEISSTFIKQLIMEGRARLLLIISAKDNQTYELQTLGEEQLFISKKKLYFSYKTQIQLIVQGLEEISFKDNEDLSEFYYQQRESITIGKGRALGFSSVEVFDGSQSHPFELFDKQIDSTIKGEMDFRLTDEVITVVYKNSRLMFKDIVPKSKQRNLNNPYLYMGMQKALTAFLVNYIGDGDLEDGIELRELEGNGLDCPLHEKLFQLMLDKNVENLDINTIDKTIAMISDNILFKYAEEVWEMSTNEN